MPKIYESFGQYYIDFGDPETIEGPFDTEYAAYKYLDSKGLIYE